MSEMGKAKRPVLDTIEAPRVLLEYKLRAARKMERTVLKMLRELADEARTERLKGQLDDHADETRGHITEHAFGPPGREPEAPSTRR